MEALDIYTVNVNPTQQRTSGLISRSKEEKEVLEHFSGIVSIKFHLILIKLKYSHLIKKIAFICLAIYNYITFTIHHKSSMLDQNFTFHILIHIYYY